MSLRFSSQVEPIIPPRRLKPPPDYRSRRVQVRLLLLVFLLMGVLAAMTEVRKPKLWEKMGFSGKADQQQPNTDEEIDPRVRGKTGPNHQPPGTVFTGSQEYVPPSTRDNQAAPNAFESAWRHGWGKVLGDVSHREREWIYRALLAFRNQLPLPAQASSQNKQTWPEALKNIDRAWSDHLRRARASLEQPRDPTPPQEKQRWVDVLDKLQSHWRDEEYVVLSALTTTSPPPRRFASTFIKLQILLDELSLQAVRDDTVFRFAEKEIWFRLLEKLQKTSPSRLAELSLGQVSYVQLFKQPDYYRGEVVTVRGVAHRAYRVPAPENSLGVKGYYVFWLRPSGGPDNPLVIYSLQSPPGFPEIHDRDHGDTTLREEVEFTGYFFKRWIYRAQDGANAAPLLVAKAPKWSPPAAGLAFSPPSPRVVIFIVIGLAAIAALVSLVVYHHTRNLVLDKENFAGVDRFQSQQVKSLQSVEQGPTIEESLRDLANTQTFPIAGEEETR